MGEPIVTGIKITTSLDDAGFKQFEKDLKTIHQTIAPANKAIEQFKRELQELDSAVKNHIITKQDYTKAVKALGESAAAAGININNLKENSSSMASQIAGWVAGLALVTKSFNYMKEAFLGWAGEERTLNKLAAQIKIFDSSAINAKDTVAAFAATMEEQGVQDDYVYESLVKILPVAGNLDNAIKAVKLSFDAASASGKEQGQVLEIIQGLIAGRDRSVVQAQKELGITAKDAAGALKEMYDKFQGGLATLQDTQKEIDRISTKMAALKDSIGEQIGYILRRNLDWIGSLQKLGEKYQWLGTLGRGALDALTFGTTALIRKLDEYQTASGDAPQKTGGAATVPSGAPSVNTKIQKEEKDKLNTKKTYEELYTEALMKELKEREAHEKAHQERLEQLRNQQGKKVLKGIEDREKAEVKAQEDTNKKLVKLWGDQAKQADKFRAMEKADIKKMSADELKLFIATLKKEYEAVKATADAEAAYKKMKAEAEAQLEKMLQQAKVQSAVEGTAQVMQMMSQAFGENKALASASALIDTYLAATKAYQAMVGIPYVGPVLAVAAAAAAIAAGMKNVEMINKQEVKSAAGGYDIPSGVNPLTQLHQDEMVLPARYANMFRAMAGGTRSQTINNTSINNSRHGAPTSIVHLKTVTGGEAVNALVDLNRKNNRGMRAYSRGVIGQSTTRTGSKRQMRPADGSRGNMRPGDGV